MKDPAKKRKLISTPTQSHCRYPPPKRTLRYPTHLIGTFGRCIYINGHPDIEVPGRAEVCVGPLSISCAIAGECGVCVRVYIWAEETSGCYRQVDGEC